MNDKDAKSMMRALETLKKQASNLINSSLPPDVMAELTPSQREEVNKAKKDLKSLDRKGLNKNSEIFKIYN